MPDVTYETGNDRFERRIGKRLPIRPLEVNWVLPPGQGRRHDDGSAVAGLIVNVSVTGAAINGPDELGLTPGSTALIRFEGHDSQVTVSRTEPSSHAGVTRYGVEFTSLHPTLKKRVYEILGSGRPAEHEWKDDT
jgi:hypothetical protein